MFQQNLGTAWGAAAAVAAKPDAEASRYRASFKMTDVYRVFLLLFGG